MPNIMKGITIFPLLTIGSFYFILTSKLDVQCMVVAKKKQTHFVQNLLKLMFNKLTTIGLFLLLM
jgi:hypothetical protein